MDLHDRLLLTSPASHSAILLDRKDWVAFAKMWVAQLDGQRPMSELPTNFNGVAVVRAPDIERSVVVGHDLTLIAL